MSKRPEDLEARLGGNLAETARLNDPGRAAARAVRQAAPEGARAAHNRRRFRLALLAAFLALAGLVLLAIRLAPG